MTKHELIEAMASAADISKAAAARALDGFIDATTSTLAAGGSLILPGFASFSTSARGERQGLNPQTQQPMTIPACNVVKFKAAKKLKDAVNQEQAETV